MSEKTISADNDDQYDDEIVALLDDIQRTLKACKKPMPTIDVTVY